MVAAPRRPIPLQQPRPPPTLGLVFSLTLGALLLAIAADCEAAALGMQLGPTCDAPRVLSSHSPAFSLASILALIAAHGTAAMLLVFAAAAIAHRWQRTLPHTSPPPAPSAAPAAAPAASTTPTAQRTPGPTPRPLRTSAHGAGVSPSASGGRPITNARALDAYLSAEEASKRQRNASEQSPGASLLIGPAASSSGASVGGGFGAGCDTRVSATALIQPSWSATLGSPNYLMTGGGARGIPQTASGLQSLCGFQAGSPYGSLSSLGGFSPHVSSPPFGSPFPLSGSEIAPGTGTRPGGHTNGLGLGPSLSPLSQTSASLSAMGASPPNALASLRTGYPLGGAAIATQSSPLGGSMSRNITSPPGVASFGNSPFASSPQFGTCGLSPFLAAASPTASLVGGTAVESSRRISTGSASGGSASKYQRAMYIPSSSDRQQDPSVIARRATRLLRSLKLLDESVERGSTLSKWRDNLRIWLAAAVVQPLSALLDANATDVTAAAAKGISVATAPAGSTSSLFGGCGGSSLFATPSMAAPPPAASGAPVSVSQWLAHTHTDASAKALAHQHTKLHRFLQVTGYGVDTKPYVRARISELARGHCLGEYKWDRGGGGWHEKLPTDAEIIVHLFKTYLDFVAAPKPDSTSVAPAPSGSSLFSGGSFLSTPFTGGIAPRPAGTGLFGGAAAPAPATTSKPALGEGVIFWKPEMAHDAFSSRHFADEGEAQLRKSDAVLIRQPGSSAGSPPRFSLFVFGTEWVVAEGEQNALDAMVLFVLQRAKHGGFLCGINLAEQSYSLWLDSLTTKGTATPPRPTSPIAFHGLLSVLHPWSHELEQLSLAQICKEVDVHH